MPAVNVRDLKKLQSLLSGGPNRAILGMLRSGNMLRNFPEASARLIKRFSAFEESAQPVKLKTFAAMHGQSKSIAANPAIAALLNTSVIQRTFPTAAKELGKRFGVTVTG